MHVEHSFSMSLVNTGDPDAVVYFSAWFCVLEFIITEQMARVTMSYML